MREFLRKFFFLFFRLFTRLEVSGLENVPEEGGAIIASNHIGFIDAPIVFSYLNRPDATALVAKKHQKNPLLRWLINNVDGIWIDRTRADFGALKQAREFLRNGGLLGVSPEGTRSDTQQLIAPKHGVAFLADKAKVPIIPGAITGTEDGVRRVLTLKRPKVRLHFGEPYRLPPLDRKNRDASLARNTDEIMCRIAMYLPPSYRGVYADHPRLKELLEAKGYQEGDPAIS
jgi:1-acyl-sn-glycerol-3-phosphate acyltransferase